MEQISQKYIKYFYIALASILSLRLAIVVITMLTVNFRKELVVSIILCIVNILLLISSIKHNTRQQFTECKTDAKILRFTLGILICFHMVVYIEKSFAWAIVTDHMIILSTVELLLTHRIKSIEYLEKLASKITKKQKEG